jgi:hypothetical protein
LNSGFDPGFDLQATLWDIGFQRTALPIDTLADGLFDRISRSITDARASGPDQNVLDELRTLEQRMGGINVIPTIGKASSILDRLPDRVGELFADIASQAFAKHHRHQV